jgi:hypothetical protein
MPRAAYASTEPRALLKAKSYAGRIFVARSSWNGSFSHQFAVVTPRSRNRASTPPLMFAP